MFEMGWKLKIGQQRKYVEVQNLCVGGVQNLCTVLIFLKVPRTYICMYPSDKFSNCVQLLYCTYACIIFSV